MKAKETKKAAIAATTETEIKTAPVAEPVSATVKTVETKEETKKTETKAPAAKAAKETTKKTATRTTKASTARTSAKAAKKETAVKATAKKTATKKTTATRAATKRAEVKTNVTLQFYGKSYTEEDLMKIAKDVWKFDLKKKVGDLKSVDLYVKPEENICYYVMNGDVEGSFAL